MAWDDDKGPGDGLPSSEWDTHVAHQKANRTTVQSTEPSVGAEGTQWADIIEVATLSQDLGTAESFDIDNVNDNAYVSPDNSNDIVSYDLSDGSERWRVTPHTAGRTRGVEYHNGNVYSAGDNVWVSLNASDGSTNWTTSNPQSWARGLTVNSNAAYFATQSSEVLYEVSLSSGSIGWNFPLNGYADNWEGLGENGSDIYVAENSNGTVVSVTSTGSQNWRISESNAASIGYDGTNNQLYVGTDLDVVALNPSDGSEIWRTAGASNISSIYYDSNNDEIYAANSGSDIGYEVLAPSDGSIKRDFGTHGIDAIRLDSGLEVYVQGRVDSDSSVDVGRYGTTNEYLLYISDGSIWMTANDWA